MKKSEISLHRAIYQIRKELKERGEDISAEKWTLFDKYRKLIRDRVVEINPALEDTTIDEAAFFFMKQRKCPHTEEEGKTKIELLLEISAEQNDKCFWEGRISRTCGDNLTLDRLKPGNRGGVYLKGNCVAACQRHNSSRGKKLIEDYLD